MYPHRSGWSGCSPWKRKHPNQLSGGSAMAKLAYPSRRLAGSVPNSFE